MRDTEGEGDRQEMTKKGVIRWLNLEVKLDRDTHRKKESERERDKEREIEIYDEDDKECKQLGG